MHGPEIGPSHASPFERIERLPDGQRGVRVDVRPSVIGQAPVLVNGPWAQNVESTDYTVYAVRQWRANSVPWDVRQLRVRVEIGTAAALQPVVATLDLPARGLAWHAQAQTLRVKPEALAGFAVAEGLEDSLLLWIARGRPVSNRVPETGIGATGNEVPAFAREVVFKATSFAPPLPLPAAPATYIEWLTPGGNVAGRQALDAALFFYGQRCYVPPGAATYSVVMAGGPPNPYGLQAEWECWA